MGIGKFEWNDNKLIVKIKKLGVCKVIDVVLQALKFQGNHQMKRI